MKHRHQLEPYISYHVCSCRGSLAEHQHSQLGVRGTAGCESGPAVGSTNGRSLRAARRSGWFGAVLFAGLVPKAGFDSGGGLIGAFERVRGHHAATLRPDGSRGAGWVGIARLGAVARLALRTVAA